MKPETVVLSGGIPKSCHLSVEHWFFFFCLHRHTCGGKRHTINLLWIGFFEVYRHILSWCRHSEIRIFILPIDVFIFSVTPSFSLVISELWRFLNFRSVINFHTVVIFVQNKEVLPGLIGICCRVEGV